MNQATIEKLLRLTRVLEVSIKFLKQTDNYFVTVRVENSALWWYSFKSDLNDCIEEVYSKAVKYGFLEA